MTTSSFDPTPDVSAQLYRRLGTTRETLIEIASEFGTDIRGLLEWANRPEISFKFALLEWALEQRAGTPLRSPGELVRGRGNMEGGWGRS